MPFRLKYLIWGSAHSITVGVYHIYLFFPDGIDAIRHCLQVSRSGKQTSLPLHSSPAIRTTLWWPHILQTCSLLPLPLPEGPSSSKSSNQGNKAGKWCKRHPAFFPSSFSPPTLLSPECPHTNLLFQFPFSVQGSSGGSIYVGSFTHQTHPNVNPSFFFFSFHLL